MLDFRYTPFLIPLCRIHFFKFFCLSCQNAFVTAILINERTFSKIINTETMSYRRFDKLVQSEFYNILSRKDELEVKDINKVIISTNDLTKKMKKKTNSRLNFIDFALIEFEKKNKK